MAVDPLTVSRVGQLAAAYSSDAEFLRSVLAASEGCIEVLDLDANLIYMSESGQKLAEVADFNAIKGCSWPETRADQGSADAWNAVAVAKAGGTGRFRGPANTFRGVLKYWDVQVRPIPGPDGQPERLLCVSRDITREYQAELALKESRERLDLTLRAGGLGFWELDLASGVLTASELSREHFGYAPFEAFSFDDMRAAIYPDDRGMAEKAFADTIAGKGDLHIRYRLTMRDGAEKWLRIQASLGSDAGRQRFHLNGISKDITTYMKNEQFRDLLNRELGHRIRNQTAVILGIVNQSLRGAVDVASAGKVIRDRLAVFSQAHEVLIQGRSDKANVREIILSAMQIHPDQRQVSLTGTHVDIGEKAGVSLALLAHELATNAIKYGALSAPAGHVDILWNIVVQEGEDTFKLDWLERGGPKVTEPERTGFGSKLIASGLPGSSGRVTVTYAPEGLRARFAVPLSSLLSDW